MSDPNDAERLLRDAQAFLRQQQELYGDTLFLDAQDQPMTPARPVPPTPMEHPISVPTEKTDLFGTTPLMPFPNEPWTAAVDLGTLNAQICACQKCGLGATRKKFVFGVGNPNAEVVVVGEAPGADEDEQGEPFVGRAGQLLNKILEAIHFRREEVYICNILKCRPPNNRDPQPEEIETCEPYLWKQLEILKPKMILCAGRVAGQALLRTNATLTQLRGRVHDYRGIRLMVTYHPAALLRNPHWKKPAWEDVQMFRRIYDELKAAESKER